MAVEDVEHAPELAEVGGPHTLLELGSQAVLAVPILVFDELIGVLALHRSERHEWSAEEAGLTETVAASSCALTNDWAPVIEFGSTPVDVVTLGSF